MVGFEQIASFHLLSKVIILEVPVPGCHLESSLGGYQALHPLSKGLGGLALVPGLGLKEVNIADKRPAAHDLGLLWHDLRW